MLQCRNDRGQPGRNGTTAKEKVAQRIPATGALRARVGEPFTARPEVGSGLLDRETGWRFPGGHGGGCATSVFVTWTSIWKFHRIATKKNLFRYKKLRDFDRENAVSHHETGRPKVSYGETPVPPGFPFSQRRPEVPPTDANCSVHSRGLWFSRAKCLH